MMSLNQPGLALRRPLGWLKKWNKKNLWSRVDRRESSSSQRRSLWWIKEWTCSASSLLFGITTGSRTHSIRSYMTTTSWVPERSTNLPPSA
jgi:hypothetical protein